MLNITETLYDILVKAKKCQNDFLAVFDLDSTLYNVSYRTQAILRDLGHKPEIESKFPKQSAVLKKIECLDTEWGIKQTLIRYKISSTLDFFEAVRSFWVEKFFSNEYLHYDVPYPGAVEFVNHLYSLGVNLHYLTGRYHDKMLEGTEKSLLTCGYPYQKEHVELHMKPTSKIQDTHYKVQYFQQKHSHYKEIYLFENEPVIIQAIHKIVPELDIIFMKSVHSGRTSEPHNLPQLNMSFPWPL